MPGTKPTKTELARMKAMSDLGLSRTAIARRMGKSHNTVIKYLDSDVYNDPTIGEIVEKIREKELDDLYVLNAKARKNLHDMLDKGKGGVIPTVAVMDRTFQQRRLLEGLSTQNLQSLTALVLAAHKGDPEKAKDGEIEGSEGETTTD
ncbi:MAG: hypothetical protein HY694_14240 [Deltaproteobacteria bacterium]|nr:hypothetical protein [Deltaproteobacteria bacterium]